MKLCAIYNVWDGVELLRGSINCLKDHVDLIIIVWQDISNFGEQYQPLLDIDLHGLSDIVLIKYEPKAEAGAMNERNKRNIGLTVARARGCTHFLHIDCDEYYEDFAAAKKLFFESGKRGSACKLYTYFKAPTLRFDTPDGYFVPFIHELRPDTFAGDRAYPFYVDPTRRINETDIVDLPVFMHHFSWVRRDIHRKVRNSSARRNIDKSTLLQDYLSEEIKAGSYVKDYGKTLITVEDQFKIEKALSLNQPREKGF